jgi:hypothetical protein
MDTQKQIQDIELTMDEVLYLEETLRRIQGTGEPIGFKDGEDLAQSILDKLEEV